MMSLTAAYLLRLATWGLTLAMFLGGPVWVSWRWWGRVLGRANAHGRHRVACGHFLALLILPGTVIGSMQLTLATMGAEISREPPHRQVLSVLDGPDAGWLAPMTVAAWLIGALLTGFRLAADAWQLHRLRCGPAPGSLAEEVRFLALRLLRGGRLTVRVAGVPVPQVMGVARPVLVVPAGLIRLPAAEREAVLLHELAHVARSDFAVNLLQRLTLVALWFQPAAWTLYRHVCREREACCDQLAVRHGASAPALARALVRLAEDRLPPPAAMAVTGRGDLRWRVNLLLASERTVPKRHHWQAALLGTLALALSGLGGAQLTMEDRAMTDLYIASALGPVVSIAAHDPGGVFGLRIRQGRVLEASVEDQPLPLTSIRQHGERVTLLGAAQEPVVSFRVTPSGRIEWQARTAKAPRG